VEVEALEAELRSPHACVSLMELSSRSEGMEAVGFTERSLRPSPNPPRNP
jgi:hypothetical protein